jgi:hypothetical protein
MGAVFVVIGVILFIIFFCWLIMRRNKADSIDVPRFRGTYYSPEDGFMVSDMRTDREVQQDAERKRSRRSILDI